MKTGVETNALALYEEALAACHAELGRGITDDAQLNRVGRYLFGPEWAGCTPADVHPDLSRERPYAIINTHAASTGGVHWLAVCWLGPRRRLLYDSFGRRSLAVTTRPAILRGSPGTKIEDADRDAEQDELTEDCGSRCLAWLVVCSLQGPEAARTI